MGTGQVYNEAFPTLSPKAGDKGGAPNGAVPEGTLGLVTHAPGIEVPRYDCVALWAEGQQVLRLGRAPLRRVLAQDDEEQLSVAGGQLSEKADPSVAVATS